MTRRWFLNLSVPEPETLNAGLAIQKLRDHTFKRWEFSAEGFRGVLSTSLVAVFVIFVILKPEMLTSAYWIAAALMMWEVVTILFPVICLLAGTAGILFWSMWNKKVIELKSAANVDLEKQWYAVKQFYSEPVIQIATPQIPDPEPAAPALPVQDPVPMYGTSFGGSTQPQLRLVTPLVDDTLEEPRESVSTH